MGANPIQVPLLCQKCSAVIQTRMVFKIPDNMRPRNKSKHASLPLLVQGFFLLCSVWMVCCCRRASCSGVTSLQSAQLQRTDSTQRVLLGVRYLGRPPGAPLARPPLHARGERPGAGSSSSVVFYQGQVNMLSRVFIIVQWGIKMRMS